MRGHLVSIRVDWGGAPGGSSCCRGSLSLPLHLWHRPKVSRFRLNPLSKEHRRVWSTSSESSFSVPTAPWAPAAPRCSPPAAATSCCWRARPRRRTRGWSARRTWPSRSRIADRMSVGTYDGDLDEAVGKADLIFEALAEDIELKKAFFDRVDKIRRPDSIVATVSSGLSIAEMAHGRAARASASNFLGIHLFNPPNVIVGTEVIPHAEHRSRSWCRRSSRCSRRRFGRVVIVADDKPAFAGNRVGFKVLNEVRAPRRRARRRVRRLPDRPVHRPRHAAAGDRRPGRLGRAQGDRRQRPRQHQGRGARRLRAARPTWPS